MKQVNTIERYKVYLLDKDTSVKYAKDLARLQKSWYEAI